MAKSIWINIKFGIVRAVKIKWSLKSNRGILEKRRVIENSKSLRTGIKIKVRKRKIIKK
jgi:hypothetical protein